jgi:hypothetical protein
VANTGMGQDIWTVPFENITMMFKVSQLPTKYLLAYTITD